MVVQIVKTKADFNLQLKNAGDKPVIVDFFATWCGPCKMIGPKLEAMSATDEMKDVIFLKVDVDENSEVAEEAEISAMPTFFVYRNGEKVDELVGANETKLCEMIKKHASGK